MTPDAIEALAARFFAAVPAGDVATLESLYADDAVVWHNYDQIGQTRAENLATLGALHRVLADWRYEEVRRDVLADGFVQQHVLRATAPGGALEVPAMMRVWCADGRITRIDEYLDTGQLGPLRVRRAGAAGGSA
jgi:ketosteroid isomerase-like protein